MSKTLCIIYVPGLGDHKYRKQQQAVATWRYWGVESELFRIGWGDTHTEWQERYDALLQRIDSILAEGKDVALVGASAGAGAVINAYAARKDRIVGVVLIAGKVNRPMAIGAGYRRRNAKFVDSAQAAPAALAKLDASDRARILSRFGFIDPIVPFTDSRIPGAHNRVQPTFTHVMTIASQITIGAPSFIRFLKRRQK